MIIPQLPFKREGDKVILTAPVFLSCGCGNVTARWATIQQNLSTRFPQGKPKSAKIIDEWLKQEDLYSKWPELKQHTYGIVVAKTPDGWEKVNIMAGAPMKAAEQIARLIERSKNAEHDNQTA